MTEIHALLSTESKSLLRISVYIYIYAVISFLTFFTNVLLLLGSLSGELLVFQEKLRGRESRVSEREADLVAREKRVAEREADLAKMFDRLTEREEQHRLDCHGKAKDLAQQKDGMGDGWGMAGGWVPGREWLEVRLWK